MAEGTTEEQIKAMPSRLASGQYISNKEPFIRQVEDVLNKNKPRE